MDGNGRWAKSRGLPRTAGHRKGVEVVRNVVESAKDLGINTLTLFGFSSENWNRPQDEINDLMKMLRTYLRSETAELHKTGVRLRVIGDRHAFDNEDVWDSISFHRKYYYDIWALSYDPYLISCFHWKEDAVAFIQEKITQKLDAISPNEFLPVLSAFNGFAVYRTDIFMRCVYDWRFQSTQKFITSDMLSKNKEAMHPNVFSNTMEMDCEHRFFHMSAVFDHGARIKICPQLLF
jgi:hypothetical protein